MDIKKALSYILGLSVGLLAVAPPIGYSIPVMVNSYTWLYSFVVMALLAFYLLFTKLPTALKVLGIYLFAGCFISEAPYASFNAYMLCIGALYCFLWFMESDFKYTLNMVCAAFFMQCSATITQLFGIDKLMNFNRTDPVFVGTVMQYMRFSSLLAIMSPIVVLKNKKFIFLVITMAILSQSSSFGLAVIAGLTTYFILRAKRYRAVILLSGAACLALYCIWDWTSISVALTCGRWKVWQDIVRTVVMDTSGEWVLPLAGEIDWKAILFGRGLDTFLPLFPIYKHDLNPFPQAHNCWLQIWWEIGLVGLTIVSAYYFNLMRRLRKNPLLVSGLVCMGVNMFSAFPTRMTQTMLMMVCFIAYCEKKARENV